jgi:hypothetical protein
MYRIITFCFVLCFLGAGFQLSASEVDTATVKKTKLVFAFDARFSSIHGQNVRINGFKLGWERFEKNRYGIGLYALRNPVPIDNKQAEVYNIGGLETDTLNLETNLSYLALFWDHIIVRKRRYEISLNMELGSGSAELGYRDSLRLDNNQNPQLFKLDKVSFGVLEFSFAGHYKVLPWIGPGAGIGYRTVLSSDENVSNAFSGPIGILKIKIFLGPLYRTVIRPYFSDEPTVK